MSSSGARMPAHVPLLIGVTGHRDLLAEEMPPLRGLSPDWVLSNDNAELLTDQRHAPMSKHFYAILREPFRVLLADDRRYDKCFDRFEYLRSLAEIDLTGEAAYGLGHLWLPLLVSFIARW